MKARNWTSLYVGVPWVDRGRDRNGFDCWGLVCVVYREQLGIELPSYGEISANELMRVTATIRERSNADPWDHKIERTDIREFDVALLRGRPMHVGVITPDLRLLHVEENTDAVCVPLNQASVAFRFLGFRRHKDLMRDAA